MSQQQNRSNGSSNIPLYVALAVIVCWICCFFGFGRLLQSLAVGAGIGCVCALFVISVIVLVKRRGDRPIGQVIAIKAAALTYAAVFAFGFISAAIYVVQVRQQSAEMLAQLEVQAAKLEAQQSEMIARSQRAGVAVQEMNGVLSQVAESAKKERLGQ